MEAGEKKSICTYCLDSFPDNKMMTLHEKGKPHLIRKYCPKCYPIVRSEKLPWSHLYYWN